MTYTPIELMISCAARVLEDGRTVAVGTGVPCAAAMLAQKTHAPNLVICFEAGGVAPQLPTMPISVGDSRTIHKAVMATSMADVMQFCQRGMMDYTFLSGAQIDPYGNLNSTLHRRHVPEAEGAAARQRRGERPGVVLLADADRHAARREEVRREARLPDHARLPDRPRRPRGGRPAARHRPVPRHHRPGRPRLPPDHPADAGAQPAPRRHAGAGARRDRVSAGRVGSRSHGPHRRRTKSCDSCARRSIRPAMSYAGAADAWFR